MNPATEKQKALLKDFAKNKELGSILNGKDFDELSSKDASGLIDRCMKKIKQKKNSKDSKKPASNYKGGFGMMDSVQLSEVEEAKIRNQHRKHCNKIMVECIKDYTDDPEMITAVFSKRADKIFTWMQRAKAEKLAQSND
jgi:hypothetical protein